MKSKMTVQKDVAHVDIWVRFQDGDVMPYPVARYIGGMSENGIIELPIEIPDEVAQQVKQAVVDAVGVYLAKK